MKRLLFSFLVLVLTFGLSGCTIKPNIGTVPIVQNKHEGSYHIINGINYQVYGAYQDKDSAKLNSILNKMKEKINNQKKTLQKKLRPYSDGEKINICQTRVFIGRYGKFRNIIEKNKLLSYCMDKVSNERKTYYVGSQSVANIKNNILQINSIYSMKRTWQKIQGLKMNKIYANDKMKRTWQKIKFLKINKILYLITELSKNTYLDELRYLHSNLLHMIKKEDIKSIPEPITVDFNKFNELL